MTAANSRKIRLGLLALVILMGAIFDLVRWPTVNNGFRTLEVVTLLILATSFFMVWRERTE